MAHSSDIALANHNMEVSRFVERCTLTDLSDTAAAQRINPDLTPWVLLSPAQGRRCGQR